MRTKNTDLKDVWQTPEWLLELLQPIHTDPCAADDTEIGDWWNFTENGCDQTWEGRVFINPPFTLKERFLKEVIQQKDSVLVDCVFVITPDSTDTKSWFHKYIANHADYIWFSKGRVAYIDPKTGKEANQPTFGTCISIYGNPGKVTLNKLNNYGMLVKTYEP